MPGQAVAPGQLVASRRGALPRKLSGTPQPSDSISRPGVGSGVGRSSDLLIVPDFAPSWPLPLTSKATKVCWVPGPLPVLVEKL